MINQESSIGGSFLNYSFMNVTPQLPDLTDNDIMPFGKYSKSNTKMIDVPAKYFLWLRDQGCDHVRVRKYIEQNLQALKKEAGLIR